MDCGIEYRSDREIEKEALTALYRANGWTVYLKDPDLLEAAYRNSLSSISAWDGDTLVGVVRAVGDGLTILYIQDLLVLPAWQRQGIGRQLLTLMTERYEGVRQKVLLTDDTPRTVAFYAACGYRRAPDMGCTAFMRIDSGN